MTKARATGVIKSGSQVAGERRVRRIYSLEAQFVQRQAKSIFQGAPLRCALGLRQSGVESCHAYPALRATHSGRGLRWPAPQSDAGVLPATEGVGMHLGGPAAALLRLLWVLATQTSPSRFSPPGRATVCCSTTALRL